MSFIVKRGAKVTYIFLIEYCLMYHWDESVFMCCEYIYFVMPNAK